MAIYCIDYINGSDVTGDGSPSAPWATLKGGVDQVTLTSGDEFRIHAGVEPVLLDSACTQTASVSTSAIINTSIDLTGSLAVGDDIFINDLTYTYRITAITSTEITAGSNNVGQSGIVLVAPRFSADGSTTFSIWKTGGVPVVVDVNSFVPKELFTTASGLTTYSDSITVSGGWADGFATKTALGRTIFYRTGAYQPTSLSPHFRFWQFVNSAFDGFLFKDFQITGGYLFYGNASNTIFGANFDNLWQNTYTSGALLGLVTRMPAANIQNFYCTNWHIPVNYGINYTMVLINSLEDTTIDVALNLSGGELTYTYVGSNLNPTINFTGTGSGVSPNISGITHKNLYNPLFWGAPVSRRPPLLFASSIPRTAMPGFSTTRNDAFLDGQVLLMDNITIEGYDMMLVNAVTPTGLNASVLVKLTQANLDKLYSLGGLALGRPRYSRIFVEAPNSPWSLAIGGPYSIDDDTGTMTSPISQQSYMWRDTAAGKSYYLLPSTVIEIDETDYVTGTNALKARPGAVGSSGNTYGPYVKLADFRIGRTQTATFTVKMKVSGVASASNVQLKYQSFQEFQTGNVSQFISGPFSTTGAQILTALESYTVTDVWADYTFTASLSNYFQGYAGEIDYVGDYYTPEMSAFLAIGLNGSPLAEAGRYIHIDSVSISII